MVWLDSDQIGLALEATFNRIQHTRMQDMPVLNPALSVQALAFKRYQQDWLGVLITPWFMNLVLLPNLPSTWHQQAPGNKFSAAFPYGVFEFTVAHDAQLGVYALCSLFSPMFEFAGQAEAVSAAQAAIQGLLTPPEAPKAQAISRRDLLRGKLSSGRT